MKKWLKKTALVLAGIGAVNWGLVAIGWNLVEWLAKVTTLDWLATLVYALVGLSGLVAIYFAFKKN